MGDLSVLPQFVQCPAGDWTPLCELRPGRKSLAIHCPQYGVAVASVEAAIINDGSIRQVVAANPLRSRLVTSVGDLGATTNTLQWYPTSGGTGGILVVQGVNFPITYDTGPNSPAAAAVWEANALGDGAHAVAILMISETYVCPGLILATNISGPLIAGPYGETPAGYWLPAQPPGGPGGGDSWFRLDERIDSALCWQQWFCWPVGATTVVVPVIEAFEVVVPPAPETYLTVQLPTVGKAAMDNLRRLQAAILAAQKPPSVEADSASENAPES